MLGQQQLSDRVYMVLAWANTLPQTCRLTAKGKVSKQCPVQRRLANVIGARKRRGGIGRNETRYLTDEQKRQRDIIQKREGRRRAAIKQGKTIRDDIRYHDVAHVWAWKRYVANIERLSHVKHDAHVREWKRDPTILHKYNVLKNLRERVTQRLADEYITKKPSDKWENILGFTYDELYVYLESQFTDGMTWENMKGWHIDHIIPVSYFKIDSIDHPRFRECFGLGNLQTLWATENKKKCNKSYSKVELGRKVKS